MKGETSYGISRIRVSGYAINILLNQTDHADGKSLIGKWHKPFYRPRGSAPAGRKSGRRWVSGYSPVLTFL